MNTSLSDLFIYMPVFIYGLIATIAATVSAVPLAFTKPSKTIRLLLSGAMLVVSLCATGAAYRAQKEEYARMTLLHDNIMATRHRNQIFILEKTAEMPLELEPLTRIEARFGGIAGMSDQEVAKWRADRIASSKANLAEILERHPEWQR